MDAAAIRRMLPGRSAKSCGPDSPTLGSSLARQAMSALTGLTRRAGRRWLESPVHRGERADRPLTPIAQGRPECFGGPVVTNACAFYHRTRGYGCAKHPAFPAPSLFPRASTCAARARRAAGSRNRVLTRGTSARRDALNEMLHCIFRRFNRPRQTLSNLST